MRKHHPKNERIKREYFVWLEEAKRMNPSSVDQVAAAIAQFEETTGHRDFAAFHFEQARKFKRVLVESTNPATGAGLAKATIYSRLMSVKANLAQHVFIRHPPNDRGVQSPICDRFRLPASSDRQRDRRRPVG